MPQTTYTEHEVDSIARIAYVTGLRDAVISAQCGELLSEEQCQVLVRFAMDRKVLRETVKTVLKIAGSLTWHEMRTYVLAPPDRVE